MRLRLEDIGPPLKESDIRAFETEARIELAGDYRAFLLQSNGGTSMSARYKHGDVDVRVGEFFSLDPSPLEGLRRYHAELKYEWGDGFVPFAMNGTGDLLCISVEDGEVYCAEGIASGEGDIHLLRISASFSSFLAELFEVPIPADIFTRIAEQGDADDVTELVTGGWSLEARSVNGFTLLEEAAKNGNLPVVRACLEKGAGIGEALHLAIRNRESDVARFLVAKGADLDALDRNGFKPEKFVFTSSEMAGLIREFRTQSGRNDR